MSHISFVPCSVSNTYFLKFSFISGDISSSIASFCSSEPFLIICDICLVASSTVYTSDAYATSTLAAANSKLPTDRFNLIYEDGYADCCMNYDEYGSHDDDSFGYDIDCIDDCNDDSFREY